MIAAVDRPVLATLAVLVLSVIAVALLVALDVRRLGGDR